MGQGGKILDGHRVQDSGVGRGKDAQQRTDERRQYTDRGCFAMGMHQPLGVLHALWFVLAGAAGASNL